MGVVNNAIVFLLLVAALRPCQGRIALLNTQMGVDRCVPSSTHQVLVHSVQNVEVGLRVTEIKLERPKAIALTCLRRFPMPIGK